MKKKALEALPLLCVPESVEVSSLSDKAFKYVYTAANVSVAGQHILQVDFYSITEKKTAYRLFATKNEFLSQCFSDGSKWSESMLEKLIGYMLPAIPVNGNSEQKIKDFLGTDDVSVKKSALYKLYAFQQEIRDAMLRLRHEKIKERIDSVFSGIEEIPENLVKWIEESPLRDCQYIFYKRSGKKLQGFCSACKSDVALAAAKHNAKGFCPDCGHAVTFKACGISSNTHDSFVFNLLQKSNNGGLINRVFEGLKNYKEGFRNPSLVYNEKRRYVCEGNSITPYYFGNFKQTDDCRWCEGYKPAFMGYSNVTDDGCLYGAKMHETLCGTPWLDSGIDLYANRGIEFDVAYYLSLYNSQNGLRFLADNGLFSLIDESLSNNYKFCKLDDAIFGILKSFKYLFPMFKKIGILADELVLMNSCKNGNVVNEDELLLLRRWEITHDFIAAMRYTSASKAIHYLQKQIIKENTARTVMITWLDYIDMACSIGYDVSSSYILFPKNLQQEHDRIRDECEKQKQVTLNENIRSIFLRLNDYFMFFDKKFIIRVPESSSEIRNEGAELHHCVGSYIERVAKNETVILFVRKVSEPDRPYFTIEYNKEEVRQCRGYCNSDPPEEVKGFLEKWLKHIKQKKIQPELASAS